MTSIRRLVMQNRRLAAWLVVVALCVNLLMPSGFMPTVEADGTITVSVCTGTGSQQMTIEMPGTGDHQTEDDGASNHERSQVPCVFVGLGLASLAVVDPIVLAIALAFILEMRFVAARAVTGVAQTYLRPPLRGPPIAA